jgi:outer membrane protein TolC
MFCCRILNSVLSFPFQKIFFQLLPAFLFFFFFKTGGFAEETLTLEEAIGIALEENFSLTTATLNALFPEIQEQIEQQAFTWRIRPGIRVESRRDQNAEGRARLDAERLTSRGTVFRASAEWVEREEGESGALTEIRAEQPLFRRYGKLYTLRNLDRAAYQREASQRSLQQETESLVLRVVEVYTASIYGKELEKQERAAVERADRLWRLVNARERQGRATGVDVLEMDLLRRQAALRLERVIESNIQTKGLLAEILGRVPEQVPPLEPVTLPEENFPDIRESEVLAWENRVELEQALADYDEAHRQVKLQKRELYPDVRLLASYQPETSLREEGWFAGVSAGQDLDLRIKKLEVEQEEAAVRAALTRVAAVELRILREVRDVHSQLRTADREVELARDQVTLSAERYRLARGLYPSGRVDAQGLRDAEVEWVRAQTQFKDAELERVRVRYRFWHTLGLLLGEG